MEELTQYTNDDGNSSRRTTVSAGGAPHEAAWEREAPPRGPGMRIKNLDTGEEYDLDEFTSREQSNTGPNPYHDPDLSATLEEEDGQTKGGKKKAWLKGTKKLKTWAKSTLSNVRDKIEERIEKQQMLRQQQQQQQQQQHLEASARSSQGGWGDGDVRREGTSGSAAGAGLSNRSILAPGGRGLVGKDGADWAGATTTASERGDDSGALHRRTLSSQDGGLASISTSAAALGPLPSWKGAGPTGDEAPMVAVGPSGAYAASSDSGFVLPVSTSAAAVEGPRASTGPLAPPLPPAPPRPPIVPPLPVGGSSAGGLPPGMAPVAIGMSAGGLGPGGGGGGSVGPLIPLAEPGAHQQSEELRVPLLEEDMAGPSSRAVPTARSWLNLPARVIGARRAANRQLQQVRMIQELYGHDGVVWAMKFSADARLLATAGRDGVLRVWSVYWYPQARSKLISVTHDNNLPVPAAASSSSSVSAASYSVAPGPSLPSCSAASYYSTGSHSHSAAGAPGAAPPAAATSPASSRPPLLSESPLLSLAGHRGDVLDLSWSQCRLLLTASADQTARLWHIDVDVGVPGGGGGGRGGGGSAGGAEGAGGGEGGGGGGGGGGCPVGECLRSFVHPDFVTSCCFHPGDPRRIVTGCADGKIRIWSVPDASVLATATVPQDMITRVVFSADGGRVVAGTHRSKACYYEFTGSSLDYLTQLDVKSAHRAGRKVTGIVQVPYTYGNDQLYVITTGDSRIRLYMGYTQERKFKGNRNTNTQIAAALSPSCQHLICGSDDGWVYVWETGLMPPPAPMAAAGQSHPGAGSAGAVAAAGSGSGGAAAGGALAGALAAGGRGRPVVSKEGSTLRGLGGKVKESSYEAFQTPETTSTVALFAPNVCRLGRGMERVEATVSGLGAAASSLLGSLFVVAGFSGRIYVYENLPP